MIDGEFKLCIEATNGLFKEGRNQVKVRLQFMNEYRKGKSLCQFA